MKITTALLKAADSSNEDEYYDSIVERMNHYAGIYAINTALRIAHFLSQIGHESGFKIVEENGKYSPERMREVFGCKGGMKNYDKTKDDCKQGQCRNKLWSEETKYANNAKNLLSYVYALKIGNGDEASGDGYTYRGRGMMQLTGKDNYAKFTTTHNNKNPDDQRDFVAHPELVTETKYGIESAYSFWDWRNINPIADSDDVVKVTFAVNSGTCGLDDRKMRLKNIKTAMGI